MRSWIIVACATLVLMNACGSSRPPSTVQDQSNQVATQTAGSVSPIQRLRMRAVRENVEAQFALAQAYDHGRDAPKDKAEAVRWYRLASLRVDVFAQNAFGENYWEGGGVQKDDTEAAR